MNLFGTSDQNFLLEFGGVKLNGNQIFILIAGVLFIIVANVIVTRLIKKSKFHKAAKGKLSKLIFRTVSYVIWFVGIAIILALLNVDIGNFFSYQIFSDDTINITVQKIFFLIVVIFALRIVVLLIDFLMNRRIERESLDYGKAKSIVQITKYIIWTVGFLFVIGAMGLKLTFIIASVSALLVGVGFGLQNIFNDFFSGIILLFDGSIKSNDVVQVGDIVGRVLDIGVRTTKVLNRDNIILIIPNSKFTSDNVINWSHHDQKTRFNVKVGVAYGSDVQLVKKVLLECAENVKGIVATPPPFVRFENFGESSLDFSLFFWSSKSFYVENIRSELRFQIDKAFNENNIAIPFPQRDVHVIDDNH